MRADAVLISGSHHRAQSLKAVIEGVGWRLRVHVDPSEALRDIRTLPYDALFCDERLKGATASGFLSWHGRLFPDAPFYLVAADGSEPATPLRGQATRVLPYPLFSAAVPPPPVSTIERERLADPEIPLEGDTRLVPLDHLIDLLGLNGGMAIVDTPMGAIHIANGLIEHASFVSAPGQSAIVGLRALAELITAPELAYRILPHRPPAQRSVNQPIMLALTESARERDERVRNQRLLAAVQEGHPHATGLAIGYPLNAAPHASLGDGTRAHALLHAYVRAATGLADIGRPKHLALEGEGVAWAITALPSDLVLSGTTAPGKSVSLLSTMVKCARTLAAASD